MSEFSATIHVSRVVTLLSQNLQGTMNVIHFVSEDVMCIIQVSEVIISQWETSSGGNSLHNPVNCTAEQNRGENAALSDTGDGGQERYVGYITAVR